MSDTERYLAVMLEDLAYKLQAMADEVLRHGLLALGSQESIGESYGRFNDCIVNTHRAILALRRGDPDAARRWLDDIRLGVE